LKAADLCITYRLHAGALALMAGVPTVIISYEDKCKDFAAFLGLDRWVVEPNSDGVIRMEELISSDIRDLVRDETRAVRRALLDGKQVTEQQFHEFTRVLSDLTKTMRHSAPKAASPILS
jgi:polysaccharide pyruvyl transferase WcaK-like protein